MNSTVQVLCARNGARPLPCTASLFIVRPDQVVRIRDGKGASVRVVAGTLWVTQDGDPRDMVLEPGDAFEFDRAGVSVLSPLGATPVRLVLGAQTAKTVAARMATPAALAGCQTCGA